MQSEAADVIQIGSHTLPLKHLKKHPSSDGNVEYIENNVHDSKLSSSASGPSAEHDGPLHRPSDHSNGWCRIRHLLREPFAEFLGTCLLIIFGTGVNLQVVLDSSKDVSPGGDKGSYLSISVSPVHSLFSGQGTGSYVSRLRTHFRSDVSGGGVSVL